MGLGAAVPRRDARVARVALTGVVRPRRTLCPPADADTLTKCPHAKSLILARFFQDLDRMSDSLVARVVVGRFRSESELACDIRGLAYHAALLAAFAALCAGLLPPWAFMLLGVCLYIRNFNAIHEAVHARPDPRNPLRRLRQLAMIVHGPLQLGRDQLASDHRRHHAHPGDPQRDPHIAVHSAGWRSGLVDALFHSEFAALQHIRRERALHPGLRGALVYSTAVSAALLAFAGADIVWWFAVTRFSSTACWFIFDYMLHSDALWGRGGALPLARPVQWLWVLMFGRDNLNATRYHTLHHRFASVRDLDLPALSQFLAERDAGALTPG